MGLLGRRALVTGASSGIGRALALALAAAGCEVYAAARRHEPLAALAATTPWITPVTMDVGLEASRAAGWAEVLALSGGYGVDILVNNAGYGQLGALADLGAAELEAQFATNVFGAAALTNLALPAMRARRFGRIVAISSLAGLVAHPYAGAYAASKHALEALSATLRLELAGSGVAVMVVRPGAIRTGFGASALAPEASAEPLGQAVVAQFRLMERLKTPPEAVAQAIVRALGRRRTPRVLTVPSALGPAAWALGLLPVAVREGLIKLGLHIAVRRT